MRILLCYCPRPPRPSCCLYVMLLLPCYKTALRSLGVLRTRLRQYRAITMVAITNTTVDAPASGLAGMLSDTTSTVRRCGAGGAAAMSLSSTTGVPGEAGAAAAFGASLTPEGMMEQSLK